MWAQRASAKVYHFELHARIGTLKCREAWGRPSLVDFKALFVLEYRWHLDTTDWKLAKILFKVLLDIWVRTQGRDGSGIDVAMALGIILFLHNM